MIPADNPVTCGNLSILEWKMENGREHKIGINGNADFGMRNKTREHQNNRKQNIRERLMTRTAEHPKLRSSAKQEGEKLRSGNC
jgi:hypothetical protein